MAARENGIGDALAALATVAIGVELTLFLVALIIGEAREFLSLEAQSFALWAVCALTVFLRLAPPPPAAQGEPHLAGCRVCGSSQASEYVTEYGWYETDVIDQGNVKNTSTTYVPVGVSRVRLCSPCVTGESARRDRRVNKIAFAIAAAAIPTLIAAGYLLGAFADVGLSAPQLSPDGSFFAWIAAIVVSIALLHPLLCLLGAALGLIDNASPREKYAREFAQAWSWQLVSAAIAAEFETEATERTSAGLRISKTTSIGPKAKGVDSWERTSQRVFPKYRKRN